MHEINPADAQSIDRRALYAPLREHRNTYTVPLNDAEAAQRGAEIAACGGACDQGRKPCTTPDACRLADVYTLYDKEEARDPREGFGAIVVPVCIAVVLAAAAFVLLVWG